MYQADYPADVGINTINNQIVIYYPTHIKMDFEYSTQSNAIRYEYVPQSDYIPDWSRYQNRSATSSYPFN